MFAFVHHWVDNVTDSVDGVTLPISRVILERMFKLRDTKINKYVVSNRTRIVPKCACFIYETDDDCFFSFYFLMQVLCTTDHLIIRVHSIFQIYEQNKIAH